jgi:hypothetical protein
VRSGVTGVKRYAIDTDTREKLNRYLFSDIPDVDIHDHPEVFIKRLEPFLIDLKIALDIDPTSRRGSRRRSLKRVMLSLTTDVIGETRIRLNRAFDYFGFVDEAVANLKDHRWWVRAVASKNCRSHAE